MWGRLKAKLRDVEDALAGFLLNPSNQQGHARYGRQPLTYQSEAAAAREPILRLLRDAQTTEARDLKRYVERLASSAYHTIPHASQRALLVHATEPPTQPVDRCFEGKASSAVAPPRSGTRARRSWRC